LGQRNKSAVKVQPLLNKFTAWILEERDIKAAALIGSYARGDANQESDVDLLLLTKQISKYIEPAGDLRWRWVEQFGEVSRCRVEDWGAVRSLRVFYKDDLEVEFGVALPEWAGIPVDPGTHRVVSNGMKILFDPRGILAKLQQEVSATLRLRER
jgi:predicted nucleotidyltransferase